MGVKSRGWENRTAQLSPIQSWNLIRPSVVSASKSGAVSPIVSAIGGSFDEVDTAKLTEPAQRSKANAGPATQLGDGRTSKPPVPTAAEGLAGRQLGHLGQAE